MKKAAIIICLATIMMSQWTSANPIGSAQALKNAQAFLQKKGIRATPGGMKRAPMVNDIGEEAPFYVFNLGNNQGFVIASGDDRATPILGLSQGIPLTPADMNEDGLITVVDVMSIVNQIFTQ